MLDGLDPILIFQIYKKLPPPTTTVSAIPIRSEAKNRITIAVIPIYLSQTKTGLHVDVQNKSIDIDTNTDSLYTGDPGPVSQKTIGAITTVNLIGKKNSTGLAIFLALSELLLDKVTSQEYEVTYLNKSVMVLGGLVHGFKYDDEANTDIVKITLELSRGQPKTKSVLVGEDPTAVRLGTLGTTPPATAATTSGSSTAGSSLITPGLK